MYVCMHMWVSVPSEMGDIVPDEDVVEAAGATELYARDFRPLRSLGKGASGQVHLVLHTPSLSLVARKSVDIWDKAKRAQMRKELVHMRLMLSLLSHSHSHSHSHSMEPY
jgi:hypothetical protein